jgi:8-oxo-dGTP pyrophosphatase MutT (NUDIX family)
MPNSASSRSSDSSRHAFDPSSQPWQVADQGLSAVGRQWFAPEPFRCLWSAISSWQQDDELGGADLRAAGREAAVLVPLVARPEGLRVMLTRRTAHLRDHAGQVSFPGGRIEDDDTGPVGAALRETFEETGLPQDYVEVLGTMPKYGTRTGFAVTPVVGLVQPGFILEPAASEVAEVFETPMEFLMNPANHRLYQATLPDGRQRQYFAMPWEGHFIWGATAGMLRNLYRTLLSAVPAVAQ